jgi:hypothetical protein
MSPDDHLNRVATATAEEVLRVIYGDDLQGCTVSLDSVAGVIQAGLEEHALTVREIAELHTKAFEAVQLLSTPPPDGNALTPEDLRSLLGERLDKIQTLTTKVLTATRSAQNAVDPDDGLLDEQA